MTADWKRRLSILAVCVDNVGCFADECKDGC